MICVNARFLCRPITGAQRYALEIARCMKQLDPDVMLVGPRDMQHPEIVAELGVEVCGRRTGVAWEQLDLPRWLRSRGRPVLLGMTFTAPLRYRPSVIVVHDVVFLRRDWVSRGFHWYYRMLVPRLCRRAGRIVTVSEFSKSEIVAKLGVHPERIDVVYNAVSPGFVEQAGALPAGVSGDYVLGVATLQPRKNFAALIRAFLRADTGDTRLVIAGAADPQIYGGETGTGELLDDPRIHLAGYVSDAELAALYRDASLFVYPSLYEGFGIPPIEAMSLGCPVITSGVTSMPEVCGDAAHYVDPTDEAELASAIERVLGDESYRRQLIEKGYQRCQRYGWQQSAEQMLEIVRGVEADAGAGGAT